MARVRDTAGTRRMIAKMPNVQTSLASAAENGAARARALAATHADTGAFAASIEVFRFPRIDWGWRATDPAAWSIEFGHHVGKRGAGERAFVPGLHIIARSARSL